MKLCCQVPGLNLKNFICILVYLMLPSVCSGEYCTVCISRNVRIVRQVSTQFMRVQVTKYCIM